MRFALREIILPIKNIIANFLLDILPNAAFAASPRKLITSYIGPAMCVRRSSDNVEADIGFLANGDLDTFALINHVGAENLLTRSDNFADSGWSKATILGATSNTAIAPDGNFTASTISLPAVSSNYSIIYQGLGLTPGSSYSASIRLRSSVGGETVYFMFTPNGISYTKVTCTLTTEWQTFTISFTATTGTNYIQLGVDKRDATQASQPAQTFYAWGAQLNTGPVALDYCRTTSAQTVSGSGFVTKMYDQSGNSRDLVQATAANQPRIVNTGVIDRVVVAENLLGWSQDFSNALWSKIQAFGGTAPVVSGTSVLAPNGTLTANTITFARSATSQASVVYQNSVTTAGVFSGCIFLQAATVADIGKTIDLYQYDGAVKNAISATLSSNWTRVIIPGGVSLTAGSTNELIAFGLNISGISTQVGSVGVNVWGAQGNTGPTARAYCPTTAAPVALGDRNVLNKPGYRTDGSASMSYSGWASTGIFGSAPSTISAVAVSTATTDQDLISWGGAATFTLRSLGSVSGSGLWRGTTAADTSSANLSSVASSVMEVFPGGAGAVATVSVNGNLAINSTPATEATNATGLYLFSRSTGGCPFLGYAADIIIFPSALSTPDRLTLEANQKTFYGTP